MTALLLITLFLQSPPPRNCRVVVAIATKHRERAYSNCLATIGIPTECHRVADGVFEERLAQLHAFADCDDEIESAEREFEVRAKDNGFPLGQAIGRGLKRLFKKGKR